MGLLLLVLALLQVHCGSDLVFTKGEERFESEDFDLLWEKEV